jgi:lysozyme family protein
VNYADLAPEYFSLFDTCAIDPARMQEVDELHAEIVKNARRYQTVEAATKVPWYVIALIHNLECGMSFFDHLHNGDSLRHPTTNDPAGRPPGWDGTGTWEQSAVDALQYDHLDQVESWDEARICFELELFNGWGYRKKGIHSPYLWAGSNHYVAGKFVSDHVYDSKSVSREIGGAVLLKRMLSLHDVSLRATAVSV